LAALVTGGASGIGAAIADRLAAGGAQVAVLDLAPETSTHFGVQCNVADDASVRAAVDAVATKFGRLDIVINNAGIGAQGDIA
ncbi:SDR family NAD(P)-dependent oxidoreductase, partial [Leclercia adecarboxylata ATCC 23216 = NBRC 102595]|nr:SDR family NAD(P)-dependent oxidoreductase [Leclercia adecarboxylata ATCC 23216 = NBRC 102595]